MPQGTVLGPILFTVFIDDLEVEVKRRLLEVLIRKFADDTKAAKVISGPEDRDRLQDSGLPLRLGGQVGDVLQRIQV